MITIGLPVIEDKEAETEVRKSLIELLGPINTIADGVASAQASVSSLQNSLSASFAGVFRTDAFYPGVF